METVYKEDCVFIQHDWQRSIRQPKDGFFVGVKPYGEKSRVSQVQVIDGKASVGEGEGVSIGKVGDRTVSIGYDGQNSTTFVAPIAEFGLIHKAPIVSVDYSPESKFLASTDSAGEFKVSHSNNEFLVRKFTDNHVMDVYRCRFFPSGTVVLSGGMDMTVRVSDVESGWNARTFIGHRAPVTDVAVIAEGRDVISASKDGTVKVWNCGSGAEVLSFVLDAGNVNAIALSDSTESPLVAVGTQQRGAFVATVNTEEPISDLGDDAVNAVAFNGTNNLFIGTAHGELTHFDLRTRRALATIRTERGAVTGLAHNDAIGLVASFSNGTIAAFRQPFSSTHSFVEFTGAYLDPVTDMVLHGDVLFAGCRDRVIRRYHMPRLY